VGAGLAGLACAYELKKVGLLATLYEASARVGGRCFSMGGSFPGPVNFPGQVVERGGEFIDTSHKTMLGYAREFGLTLEDVNKAPGEVVYFFDGSSVPERNVVEEFRALVSTMRVDLRALSNAPTADNHTPADVALDFVNLEQYLKTRGAGSLAFAAIEQAYIAEYGLTIVRVA
jgi:monoamine oxidase